VENFGDEIQDAFDPDLDASPLSPEEAIPEYGIDSALDRLADRCGGSGTGADDACSDLWVQSPVGSGYESYGDSCGERPGRESFACFPGRHNWLCPADHIDADRGEWRCRRVRVGNRIG
jgi:hypothetical protein